MKRRWPLTVRGTSAVILAIAFFILAHEAGLIELVYFGVLLSVVVLGSLVSLHLPRRGEDVTRTLAPDGAAVGRESAVVVRVGVRAAVPTPPGRWQDALSEGVEGRATGVFPVTGSALLGTQRYVELRYCVEGVSRGIHWLGPLSVTTTDPFGLVCRRYRLGTRSRIVVSPAVVDLAALPAASGEAGGMLQSTDARLGEGADNLVARPYAPGDSMRRIHWRATAHRDELMVRQEEQEASPEATVVLDRGALRWGTEALLAPGADPGFEIGVSACLSAAMRLVRDGYTVQVLDTDGAALSEPIAGGELREVEALVSQFATLTTRKGDDLARLSRMFTGVRTGPVVLITGRLSREDTRSLGPLAHHSALPVLLAVSAGFDPLERVRELGWRAAGIGLDGDIARSWEAALQRGPARVG